MEDVIPSVDSTKRAKRPELISAVSALSAILLTCPVIRAAEESPEAAALRNEIAGKGWIAYGARSPKGDWDIFLMRPDGTHVRNITGTPTFNEAGPRFSPDGKRLLWRRLDRKAVIDHDRWGFQGSLMIARSDGSAAEAYGEPKAYPWASWSPGGAKLACLSIKGVTIYDLATKRPLRTMPRQGFYQQLFWSPDGKWFCGTANLKGENWTVAKMDATTGEVSSIHSFRNCTPDWFPDSRRVLFSNRPKGQRGYGWTQLWWASLDGKRSGLLYGQDGRHVYGGALSPDGTYVLFTWGDQDGSGAEKSGGRIGVARLADTPIITGESQDLSKKHPKTNAGPLVEIGVGWEPDWTYREIGGAP